MVRLIMLLGVAQLGIACGQKGPLVLPDAQHPHKKIGVPRPPPASAPQPEAPAGLPSSKPAPTDATATGEAKTAPAPPQ
jgi:predicted small lipoprotein YifL